MKRNPTVIANRYELGTLLGTGNFGLVYLSTQWMFDRPVRRVAVKVSKAVGLSRADAADMLSDAVTLATALDTMTDAEARAHLVHVYDAGLAEELDSCAYIVMEYVPGPTLADEMAAYSRVPEPLLLSWMTQLCRALRGLHTLDNPLVHRDIKPNNVLLGLDKKVRLVDFGLAARMDGPAGVPGVAGTTTYMAPETTKGTSTPSSDVYSLGVVMYEALTGRHPFAHLVEPPGLSDKAASQWLYEHKRLDSPRPPSAVNGTVSSATDGLVLRCLEFDPRRRFRDSTELAEELPALTRKPPRAVPVARTRVDLERQLRNARPDSPELFAVRLAIGDLLESSGDFTAAASILRAAWEQTRGRGLLPSRAARVKLLSRIAACYAKAGNGFQQRRFEALRDREAGGGRL